jgi:hypothetical protein
MIPARTTSRRFLLGALVLCLAWAGPSHAGDLPSVELPSPLARVLTDYEAAWQAGSFFRGARRRCEAARP